MLIQSSPSCDLSQANENKGIWIDEYENKENNIYLKHEYPVRLYQDDQNIERFIKGIKFSFVDKIFNYQKQNINDPGWIEYVFEKVK